MFLSSSSSWVGRMLSRLKWKWNENQCKFIGRFNLSSRAREIFEGENEASALCKQCDSLQDHSSYYSRVIFSRDSCYFKLVFSWAGLLDDGLTSIKKGEKKRLSRNELYITQFHCYWKIILIINSLTTEEKRRNCRIAKVKHEEGKKITKPHRFSISGWFTQLSLHREDILQQLYFHNQLTARLFE